MKSLMPRSRATTAYGLLKAVQRLILAEPKRYNQNIYLAYKDDSDGAWSLVYDVDFPACGTVGCVAGWIAALTQPNSQIEGSKVRSIAKKVLGKKVDPFRLFSSSVVSSSASPEYFHWPWASRHHNLWPVHNRLAKPGTRIYAKAGVAHIQRFIDANLLALKARKVRITGLAQRLHKR